ncbi:hypothetical protein [Actinocorallia populi]|nr:hypothetical protein [Actinocorallia populi]
MPCRPPLRKPNGHELKPQFRLDQMRDRLGLPLATGGQATRTTPGTAPG